MYGVVYRVVNNVNGKCYVGQSVNPSVRKRDHFSNNVLRSSPVLHKSMSKHGLENFAFEILDTVYSKEDLDNREIYWIYKLNSMLPDGYNIREGGARGKLSESSKRKISKANKGRLVGEKNPCYGRTGSKSPLYGKPGPNLGKKLSQVQRKLISDSITGMRRSAKTKEASRLAALNRWEKKRAHHFVEKGHEYAPIGVSGGNLRCRVCKNMGERRRYRGLIKAESKPAEKKSGKKKKGK